MNFIKSLGKQLAAKGIVLFPTDAAIRAHAGELRPDLVAGAGRLVRAARSQRRSEEENDMTGKVARLIFALILAVAVTIPLATPALAQTITLRGASQFDDTHPFNQGMLKFEELVKKYYGKPINFIASSSQGNTLFHCPIGYGHRSVEYIVKACCRAGAMAGGIAPDVMYVNFRISETYISQGFLYPLDDYIAKWEKELTDQPA